MERAMGTVHRCQPIDVKEIYPEWVAGLDRIMYRCSALDKSALSTERCRHPYTAIAPAFLIRGRSPSTGRLEVAGSCCPTATELPSTQCERLSQ